MLTNLHGRQAETTLPFALDVIHVQHGHITRRDHLPQLLALPQALNAGLCRLFYQIESIEIGRVATEHQGVKLRLSPPIEVHDLAI
jgi:hypothetical protein